MATQIRSVPAGFEGGAALDFASAFWCWLVYHLTVSLKWVGAISVGSLAVAMAVVNRKVWNRKERKEHKE